MKNKYIFSSIILLFFSFSFLIVGYAAISRDLNIKGNVEINPPVKKIYISDAKFYSSSGVNSVSFDYIYPTNFTSTVNAQSINGSITYEITVHNNTDVTYWYHGINLVDDFESNHHISTTNGIGIITKDKSSDNYLSFDTEDWIPPKSYRTFYITYTYGRNVQGYHATFVNFHFDVKMDSVHDSFLNILNDKTSQYGYYYLANALEEKYRETGSTVIGNIGEDKEIFNNLFGGELTLEVNGVQKPVTLLIRRENVDSQSTGDSYNGGPSGCEYTLYITVDDLSSSNGQATVYAISYTISSTGQLWYQLAELYEGKANITDYDTSTSTHEGSFDISSWKATQNDYHVADGLVYKVGYEQGDQYDKMYKLEDLMSVFDQDIFNDIDNNKIMKKVYDLLMDNQNSATDEVYILRQAYNKALPYFQNFNNGQEFKVKREYTRAQIIPIIEELQDAYDYFNQIQ